MRIEQQPALILHGRPYRETSMLLECFTRDHGRVGLVARGVRRERARLPRALLQPLTPLSIGWSGSGELATLSAVEAGGAPFGLAGEALLCGLYVNELLLRLTMRHDPHPGLFARLVETLQRLGSDSSTAWTLRRFERDALGELGYGLDLATEAVSGEPLDPAASYGYRHELGAVAWRGSQDGPRVSGAALLALAADCRPADADLAALRRWLRAVITAHLGGAELHSWKLLAGSRTGR
jgi:DNA repair protein RecO (recombination protein O)